MRVGAALGARDLVALARASRGLRGGALDPRGVGGAPGRGRWGRGALRLGRASGQGLGAAAGLLSNLQETLSETLCQRASLPGRVGDRCRGLPLPGRVGGRCGGPRRGPPGKRRAPRPSTPRGPPPSAPARPLPPAREAGGGRGRRRESGAAAAPVRGPRRAGAAEGRGHSCGAGSGLEMRGPGLVKTEIVKTKNDKKKRRAFSPVTSSPLQLAKKESPSANRIYYALTLRARRPV